MSPTTNTLLTPEQLTEAASMVCIKPIYLCPICGKAHNTSADAFVCSQRNEQPVAKPGDIVVIENGYGWHDGHDSWVYDEKGYKFHGKPTLRFWFVITDVTQKRPALEHRGDSDAHRLAYHVQTLGLFNGMEGGRGGWTCVGTHIGFKKPSRKPPASVVEAARGMVGRRFSNLL